ncbi:MAG: FtsX-like permease family protein, partial [Ezakiella massiliensis]
LTSILLLSTVSLITSGIFLLLLQSRKKEIAISLACGSTIKTQIKELILEIGLLILYGMVVGVAIAYMYGDIVEQISIARTNLLTGTTIVTNIEPFIVLLITGLIILLTSSILIIKAIKKLNPIEILQNE